MKKPVVYISTYCPFCHMVQNFVLKNDIEVEYKNIDNSEIRDELMKIWWKTQVPYLVDADRNISMYESRDITDYLAEYYG